MTAKIISAFPACGKTTYYRAWSEYSPENVGRVRNGEKQVLNNILLPHGNKILDSGSSLFSWIYDKDGNNTNIRNPDFPNSYIQHIKNHISTSAVLFVGSHRVVRDALRENGIFYYLIYPERDMKDEWMRRFKERGNDDAFIEFQKTHWNEFIDEMENEIFPKKIRLNSLANQDAITVNVMKKIMEHQEG